MNRSKTKTPLIVILLAAIAIGLFLWWYLFLSQPEHSSYLPELVAGETDAEGESGLWMGYDYYDPESDSFELCPSLSGVWQLDESYGKVVTLPADAETLSVRFPDGDRSLRSFRLYYFDRSWVDGEPGTAPDWSDGVYVETERHCYSRHGREYIVTDPQPGVYVARFVTDAGVTEVGWLVEAE